jgi:hypothetical protein
MKKKNPHAVALGRIGGKSGTGKSKARISEQARAAVSIRWRTLLKEAREARESGKKGIFG